MLYILKTQDNKIIKRHQNQIRKSSINYNKSLSQETFNNAQRLINFQQPTNITIPNSSNNEIPCTSSSLLSQANDGLPYSLSPHSESTPQSQTNTGSTCIENIPNVRKSTRIKRKPNLYYPYTYK